MKHLSLVEAERLASTKPSDDDVLFLKALYGSDTFLHVPIMDQTDRKDRPAQFPDDQDDIEHRARRLFGLLSPNQRKYITFEMMVVAIREHQGASNEILGDYPKRLKKWVIWVLAKYADQLAKVTFASFRLDEIDARALVLPSGSSAVIINTSFLLVIPLVASALVRIYDDGTSQRGVFDVPNSDHTAFILQAATYAANPTDEALEKLMRAGGKLYFPPGPGESQIGIYCGLLAALHESAHIVLGHLSPRPPWTDKIMFSIGGKRVNPEVCQFSAIQEIEADTFAVKSLLELDESSLLEADEMPRNNHLLKVALACATLYGFLNLVSGYSAKKDTLHPGSSDRWRNVVGELLSATDQLLTNRLNLILQTLSVIQLVERRM